MLVEFQRRGRIWTFREFLSSGGRPLISEWYLSLLQPVRAVFDDRLDFLAIHERKDWQLPEFRMLRGKEGKAGLSEIRWESEGTQWRILGFFRPGRMQYTMLIGCTHRQKQYDPRDPLETAIRRKKSVERGERTTILYE